MSGSQQAAGRGLVAEVRVSSGMRGEKEFNKTTGGCRGKEGKGLDKS